MISPFPKAKLLWGLFFQTHCLWLYKKKNDKLATSLENYFQKSLVSKTVGLKCMSDFIRSSHGRDHEKGTRNVVEGFLWGFGGGGVEGCWFFFFCIGRWRKVIIQEGEIKINLKRAGMLDRIGFSCSWNVLCSYTGKAFLLTRGICKS